MATAGPEVPPSTGWSQHTRRVAGLLLALWLTGCSAGAPVPAPAPGTASPSPSTPPSSPGTPTPPSSAGPTASPSPSGGGTGWNADGPSFGVDRAVWPFTVKEAERLLAALPETFEGLPRRIARPPGETGELGETGPSAGAQYGDQRSVSVAESFTTTDTEDGKRARMSAAELLGANFLMSLTCVEGSYQGTARPAPGGVGPATTGKAAKGPVWFSCAAQDEEGVAAQVVGWTSGKTAWQVLAPDEASLRSLVTEVHTALG